MKLGVLLVVVWPLALEAKTVKMETTGYCPCKACCGPRAKGITASGAPAKGRIVAAPPKYKFGTKMTIPGYGTALVKDRGGAIQAAGVTLKKGMKVGKDIVPVRTLKYDRLDLLFPTHSAALKWGKRIVDVEVN